MLHHQKKRFGGSPPAFFVEKAGNQTIRQLFIYLFYYKNRTQGTHTHTRFCLVLNSVTGHRHVSSSCSAAIVTNSRAHVYMQQEDYILKAVVTL